MKYKKLIILPILLLTVCCCNFIPKQWPEPGVSQSLAKERAERILSLDYVLNMDVPEQKEKPITAQSEISFSLFSTSDDIFLDFKADSSQLKQVVLNEDTIVPLIVNEHIKLPSSLLKKSNLVVIDFIMGNSPLNRNDNYLYSLFVPDRARTAIPCFDQPDIKGEFSVIMTIPSKWNAITNGPQIICQELNNNRKTVEFARSRPISTYLWAFATGEFEYTSTKWKDKTIGLYHMVNDSVKFNNNIQTIFNQTRESLNWLEDYTNYTYPYDIYNLIAIPSFQFGGMEHPGATYYRSELIFLDEEPTTDEELRRANLIAHETAHMWFGDLVTMPWFDEVWLKEVFANFMADKITQPWFPDINHQLRFLTAHFPSAYSVDRTRGSNPITQKLKNLQNAGTLYGSIIYHKSPIVMAQLEDMVGADILQAGIREYINTYAFGNASWNDLINYIDRRTENNLKIWSHSWINEPGRPVIMMRPPDETNPNWQLVQKSEFNGLSTPTTFWPQKIVINNNGTSSLMECYDTVINTNEIIANSQTIVFSDEKGYGLFRMNGNQINYWLENTNSLTDPLLRGRSAINLYENLLDGAIEPLAYIHFLLNLINKEQEALLISLYGQQLKQTFWYFLSQNQWLPTSRKITTILKNKARQTKDNAIKKQIFRLWINLSLHDEDLGKMAQLCNHNIKFHDIELSEKDQSDLIIQLAIKQYQGWKELYNDLMINIKNKDLKAQMTFLLPALSNNIKTRDEFWLSLANVKQRSKEKWVETALSCLHHSLRHEHSKKYLPATLDLLEEIQATGDIFFPIGWLKNSIGKYSSDETTRIVHNFIEEHLSYPNNLKNKILQQTDMARRSAVIKKQHPETVRH